MPSDGPEDMRGSITLSGCIFWGLIASAQTPNSTQPTLAQDLQNQVSCQTVKGLSVAIKRTLSATARCRLDVDSLECGPGLKLIKDAHENRDLCRTTDGRFISPPKCHSRKRKLYTQSVIRRGDYVVQRPDEVAEIETIDIPFTRTGRYEILAQSAPVIRIGPDQCVYLGRSPLIHDQRHKHRRPKGPAKSAP